MAQHKIPWAFDEVDHSPEPGREVVSAWIVVVLLLVATAIGFVLDHAATISP